jgi:hypothetical protein
VSACRLLTFLFPLIVVSSSALADSPPSLPATHYVSSANNAIMVISSLDQGTQILE